MKTKISRHFTHFAVSGFTYYDGYEVFAKLKIGAELQMKAEPDNRYDPHAVSLWLGDKQLGYIPRGQNKEISRLLVMGYDIFEAFVNRLSPDEHPENQVGVVVKIKEKK